MSTYKRSTYNVLKDGKIIARNKRPIEAAEIANCDVSIISQYAKKGVTWRRNSGLYTFEIAETVIREAKVKKPKTGDVDYMKMPQNWIDGWEDMKTAAKALKTGHGIIIAKNGTKYVVMI